MSDESPTRPQRAACRMAGILTLFTPRHAPKLCRCNRAVLRVRWFPDILSLMRKTQPPLSSVVLPRPCRIADDHKLFAVGQYNADQLAARMPVAQRMKFE